MKPFRQGCILGRFQPLHIGHAHLIEEALKRCDHVLVFVGSSQESRTEHNPFSYEERVTMLRSVFGEKIDIAPLPDLGLGDVHAWGDHIIEEAKRIGHDVDCFVLGEELKNDKWFSPNVRSSIELLQIDRLEIPISATAIRQALKENDQKTFEEYIPKGLHQYFQDYRRIILEIPQ